MKKILFVMMFVFIVVGLYAISTIQSANTITNEAQQIAYAKSSPYFVYNVQKTDSLSGAVARFNTNWGFMKKTVNGVGVKYLIEGIGITVGDTVISENDSVHVQVLVGNVIRFTKHFIAKGKLPQDSCNLTSLKIPLDSGQVVYKITSTHIDRGNFQIHIKWREYLQPGL